MKMTDLLPLKVNTFNIMTKEREVGWMDGWMTCNFMSFSTVFQSYQDKGKLFQSYQDNGKLIMKGCVQWNSVYS